MLPQEAHHEQNGVLGFRLCEIVNCSSQRASELEWNLFKYTQLTVIDTDEKAKR